MVEKAADALHGLENNIGKNTTPAQAAQEQTPPAVDHPLQVEVHQPPPGPVQILQSILSALLPPLATAAIVIISSGVYLFREDLFMPPPQGCRGIPRDRDY